MVPGVQDIGTNGDVKPPSARCPECPWTGGPFTTPAKAVDALLEHVNNKHAALIGFLRAKPLPSSNEGFARACVQDVMGQANKIQKAINSPIATGPVDVPSEMIAFILHASNALSAMLDILLEMRTGQPVMILKPRSGPEAQP